MTDPLLRLLADLPRAEPDRERAARVKAKCRAVLARGRQPRPSGIGSGRLTDVFLVGLSAAYLIEAILETLHLAVRP